MSTDLSRYLGAEFAGKYPQDYLTATYADSLPIFHLVGGVDKLTESEITDSDPQDGMPVSLDQWIKRDGVFCLKVKLRGTDAERTASVDRVGSQAIKATGSTCTSCRN